MTLSLIVAMGENRVIGLHNSLPWHLPADLKYFKKTTLGKPIIMGRKTFDSIGRALPGRRNIVVTRNANWCFEGVETVGSLEAALTLVGDVPEIMVTGGAQIYADALPIADRLYITEVNVTVEGDAVFPAFDLTRWVEVSRESHPADSECPAYAFVTYERRSG